MELLRGKYTFTYNFDCSKLEHTSVYLKYIPQNPIGTIFGLFYGPIILVFIYKVEIEKCQ